ncbi:MAG: NAD(P)/FAD-dependent oxidoreductase [Planctomycetia bacterium]|nr:NAD(P)/FAD-dependent oxidoreductase [Planctomycetia bacterium]
MISPTYDVAIIGAGIVGASLFHQLGRFQQKAVLIERENDVALGSSRANSAIVHAGYDPPNGSLMAKFNVEGNRLFDTLCEDLAVPFKRNGSLVLAFTEEEEKQLEFLLENGKKNGVPGLELWTSEQVALKEPNLAKCRQALFAPTGGIVGVYELTTALAENGLVNGGDILLESEVTGIEKIAGNPDYFKITLRGGRTILSRFLVNAAGLFADKIHALIAPVNYTIHPNKGEYFLFDHSEGNCVNHTLFRVPSRVGKGVLVSPTVHGNLLVGPNSIQTDDPDDTATTGSGLESVKQGALETVPGLNFRKNIRNFAGVRARSSRSDFIVEEVPDVPGMIDLAGIKSPGLTSAPAIALAALELLEHAGLELKEKTTFLSRREQVYFMALSPEEKCKLIQKDAAYGRIICRCESITEGEILESIRRPLGARTVDGVKRRCRPGSGRCQGGFCLPKVMAILARELGVPVEQIQQDRTGSWIVCPSNKRTAEQTEKNAGGKTDV